jgi:hypothetical protein
MADKKINEMNLAAPCGMYCGSCRSYLLLTKNLLAERGYKRGCEGCRVRNKNCVFIKKNCALFKKQEIDFCYQCDKLPCSNRGRIDQIYKDKYGIDLVGNLQRLKEIGVKEWLKEQEAKWKCPECGGTVCVHDRECFECGYKY